LLLIHHNQDLSKKKKVHLKDVNDRPWVMYPQDYYLNQTLRETFKNQMVDFPTAAARYTMPEQILKFAINTGTNTALPKSYMVNINLKDLTNDDIFVSEFDPKIKFDLKFVYRKNKNEIPRIGRFLSKFDEFLNTKDYLSRLAD
jgi:hypothetical protein